MKALGIADLNEIVRLHGISTRCKMAQETVGFIVVSMRAQGGEFSDLADELESFYDTLEKVDRKAFDARCHIVDGAPYVEEVSE